MPIYRLQVLQNTSEQPLTEQTLQKANATHTHTHTHTYTHQCYFHNLNLSDNGFMLCHKMLSSRAVISWRSNDHSWEAQQESRCSNEQTMEWCIGIGKHEGESGALNLPAVCRRGRILMRLKQTNGARGGERRGERRGAGGRWHKAEGR